MKVKTIKNFKDLTINKVRTTEDDPFDVDKGRASLLIQRGFVEEYIETSIPKKSKENATLKISKKK